MAIIVIIVVVLAAALLALWWARGEIKRLDGAICALVRRLNDTDSAVWVCDLTTTEERCLGDGVYEVNCGFDRKPRLDAVEKRLEAEVLTLQTAHDESRGRLAKLEAAKLEHRLADLEKWRAARIDILARHFQEHASAVSVVDALRESFNAFEACVNGRLNMLENQLGEIIDGTPSRLNARLAALESRKPAAQGKRGRK